MVEIRYKDHYRVADLAGQTLAGVREQLKEDFSIPDNATAKLNGKKVKKIYEAQTCLNDDDTVSFSDASGRGIFLISACLIALTLCGGWFAYGYVTSSVSLSVDVSEADFVVVTVNNSSPLSWQLMASYYGSTGNGTLFDIDTASSDYTGDLIVTIYHTNGGELIDVYRYFNLSIAVFDSAGNLVDINDDDSADIADDNVLLTLKNGSVDMFITQTTADIYTVKILDGYFLTQPSWTSGHEAPRLYCEVANK